MIPAYALYRRSRAHQDLSTEEQREAVRAWAVANGYEIIREFADDGSGLDTDRRRGFLALLGLCSDPRRRAADVVLVYDVSRFSRLEPDEAAFHEHSLRRAGVQVIYTHEPGVNEAGVAGYLVKGLKRVMAHEYSQKLSQVVQRGLRAHAERGHWTGGRAPYGYRRAVRQADGALCPLPAGRWKAKNETVVLVVEPCEAPIVVEIYELYAHRGFGLAAIASALNARGVPLPASDRRRGVRAWTKGTIWAILRNPVYTGALIYGKARYSELGKKRGKRRRPADEWIRIENAAPVIVPPALWGAAQAKHGTRKFGVGRPWHRPYLLSSLIVCAHCGKHFQAHKQTRGRVTAYYVCAGYAGSGRGVCDAPRVPVSYLEDAVLDGITKRLERVIDPEVLRGQLRELLAAERNPEPAIPALEMRLADTQRKILRFVDALSAGPEDLPSVRAALVEYERERERLERELERARALAAGAPSDLDATVTVLIESLARFRDVLAAGEPEERKVVVRAFLQSIRIDKGIRQAILSWYRLPRLEEGSVKLVELRGFEPLTPRLPALCSPS